MDGFDLNLQDRFVDWLASFIPSLIAAIMIAVVGWFAAKWGQRLIGRVALQRSWDEVLWSYVSTVFRTIFLVVIFIAALKQVGFPVDSLLVSFGISGVIIGMGARQSIQNYFAGLMMLGARPFKKGDLIEFGPPAQIGTVTEVRMTYTGLITLDNVRIVVPNSVIWRNKIVNFSTYDKRAIRVPIAIPYDVDIDWVRDIALDVLVRHDAVLSEPPPKFSVSDVGAENVRALLVAWSDVQTMNVFGDVLIALRKEFEAADLPVTVPASDIDLKREE